MNHPLLVARLVIGEQLRVLRKRLADAGHIAVAEDPETPLDEPMLDPIALDMLDGEKTDERLSHGQANRAHHRVTTTFLRV